MKSFPLAIALTVLLVGDGGPSVGFTDGPRAKDLSSRTAVRDKRTRELQSAATIRELPGATYRPLATLIVTIVLSIAAGVRTAGWMNTDPRMRSQSKR